MSRQSEREAEIKDAQAWGAAVERKRCLEVCQQVTKEIVDRLLPEGQILSPTDRDIREDRLKQCQAVIKVIVKGIADPKGTGMGMS